MQRLPALLFVTLLIAVAFAGCATNPSSAPTLTPVSGAGSQACDASPIPPDPAWQAQSPRVKLITSMGDIMLELSNEGAPLTVGNFLNLTNTKFYDGQSFYRVAKGFVIQGGSRGGAPDAIPDEFNPSLRHDAAGTLSMATAGPDTGSSEFFITLAAASRLDDRHAVFGHVVEGLDVVNAIGNLPTSPPGDGQPTPGVEITKAEIVPPASFEGTHAVGIHAVISEKKAEAGRSETFAVVLENAGSVRDAIGIRATLPTGWTCRVNERPVVPAGTARVVFVTITPPSEATARTDIPLTAVSAWNGTSEASTNVTLTIGTLGAQVKDGDSVTANYVGFLPDGRLFDTSVERVAHDDTMPKFTTQGGWRGPRPSYAPFDFTVGSGVIAGFTNLAKTAKEGETVTMRIPAADAYAQGDMYQRPLTGRDLVFELEILKIN